MKCSVIYTLTREMSGMRPDEDREPERDVQPVLDGRAADVDGLFGGVTRIDGATPADEFIDMVLL